LIAITLKSRVGALYGHEIFRAEKFEIIAIHKNENLMTELEVGFKMI